MRRLFWGFIGWVILFHAPVLAKQKFAIGTVDFQKALLTVGEGKNTKKQLDKEAAIVRKDLEKKARELKKMESELQGLSSSILSDEAKMKKGREFQQKYMSLKKEEQVRFEELKRKEAEEVEKVFRKLKIVTKDISKKKKLTLALEKNASGLIFAENSVDITDEVIVEYDRRYKVKSIKSKSKKGKKGKKGK